MTSRRRLWIALPVLALLSPLGLYLPELVRAGSAWGEWGLDEIRALLGYIPEGMARTAEVWKPPLPKYGVAEPGKASLAWRSLASILSAFLGMAACAAGANVVGRWLSRGKR